MTPLDVGGVEAKLSARVDERGFRQFDAAMAKAERARASGELKVDVDESSFRRAEARLNRLSQHQGTAMLNVSKGLTKLIGDFGEFRREGTWLGKTLDLLKFDKLFVGAGVASEGILTLTGAVVGLSSALAPLTGALVAYPAMLGALGQAAGVVALSGMNDLTEAMGGNEDAIKRLTPQARRFMHALEDLKPRFDRLKSAVQGPLFGGLERGLGAAMKNFAPFRRVMEGTADALGDLAAEAGKMVGRDGFGRDLEAIGNMNTRTIRRLGGAGLDLAQALRHVLRAGQPLIDWMTKGIEGWAQNVKGAARMGRETGQLAEFFEKTRRVMERLGAISGNLAHAFGEIGHAAAPLGRWMLRTFESITGEFAKWSSSKSGHHELRHFFDGLRKPLAEIGMLIRDVGAGFLDIGTGHALPRFIRLFRTEFVPVFIDWVKHALHVFSDPAMMKNFAEFIRLFGTLIGFTFPIEAMLDAFGGIARFVNNIFEAAPFVRTLAINLGGLGAAISALGLARAVSELFGFRRGLAVLKGIPGVSRAVAGLGSAFETVALHALTAKDAAATWLGNFAAGVRTRAGRVRTAIRGVLTRAATFTSAAAEAVGTFVGGMVGRFKSSRLGQRLTPIFRAMALRLGGVIAAAVAGAVLVGEGIGGFAAGLVGRLRARLPQRGLDIGKRMGGRLGRGIIIGLLLALPLLVKEAYELGRKLGEVIRDAIKDEISGIVTGGMTSEITYDDVRGEVSPGEAHAMGIPGAPRPVRPDAPGGGRMAHELGGKSVESPVGEKAVEETEKRSKRIRDEVKKTYDESHRKARDRSKNLRDDTAKAFKGAAESVEERSKAMRRDVGTSFEAQSKTAQERGREFSGSVKKTMTSADEAVGESMDSIMDQVNKALKTLGLDPVKFGSETGKPTKAKGGKEGAARGGVLSGYSRVDNRTINVRGGEAILRPEDQIPTVDMAMRMAFGVGLFDYMRAGGSRMGFARGGIAPPGFAPGGMVEPAGDPGAEVLNRSIAAPFARWAKTFGADLTAGYDPGGGHVSPGHNVTGTATDVVPLGGWTSAGTARFEQGLRALEGKVPQILYGTAGIGTPWPNHGRDNHAHIEWGGDASGVGGFAPIRLRKPEITGPEGPLRDIAQAAVDRVFAGARRKIAREQASALPGSGIPGIGSAQAYKGPLDRVFPSHYLGEPGVQLTKGQVSGLVAKAGLPSVFNAIVDRESARYPGVIGRDPNGYSFGRGLTQITFEVQSAATQAALKAIGNPFNPWENLLMAKWMMRQAGGISPWAPSGPYALGGVVPGGTAFDPLSIVAPDWGGLHHAQRWDRRVASLRERIAELREASRKAARRSARLAEHGVVGGTKGGRGGGRRGGNFEDTGKIAIGEALALTVAQSPLAKLRERLERAKRKASSPRTLERLAAARTSVAGSLIAGFGSIEQAATLGASGSSVEAGLARLAQSPNTPFESGSSYAQQMVQRIRRTMAIGAAQRTAIGSGFAAGGVAGGGTAIVPVPMPTGVPPITLVVEGSAAALDLRVREVYYQQEADRDRRIGLGRQTPARRAAYAKGN